MRHAKPQPRADRLLVRKSAFAGMCGVTPGRVSQWIAEGKIHGSALVSRGRVEMVDADLAREQLRDSLDVDKRFGLNGLSTNLRGPSDQATLSDSTVEEQIRAEKLRHAQLLTSRLEEEDRARRGVYVEAEKVRGEIALAATDLLRAFEGSLPDFASAVAAKFHVPQRDALHLLRGEFRRLRDRVSASHAKAAAALPRTVIVDDPQPDSFQ